MTAGADEAPLLIAIAVGDPEVAGRLAAALDRAPGLELVGDKADADVVVVASAPAARSPETDAALTPRELEVLALLAEGASNKTIARRLGITPHTVKFHVRSLLDKLDAVSRTDAVAHAARIGAIEL